MIISNISLTTKAKANKKQMFILIIEKAKVSLKPTLVIFRLESWPKVRKLNVHLNKLGQADDSHSNEQNPNSPIVNG